MSKYALKSGSGEQLPNGVMLQVIIARMDFITADNVLVSAGDEGGMIQSVNNLSQEGSCWVHKGGKVYGKARVVEDAVVCNGMELNGRSLLKGSTIAAPVKVSVQEVDLASLNLAYGNATPRPSLAERTEIASHLLDLPL